LPGPSVRVFFAVFSVRERRCQSLVRRTDALQLKFGREVEDVDGCSSEIGTSPVSIFLFPPLMPGQEAWPPPLTSQRPTDTPQVVPVLSSCFLLSLPDG